MIIRPKLLFPFVIATDPEFLSKLNWGGWGNGYVAVMPGHPLYEMDYYKLQETYDIDVHGGLTYSGYAQSLRGYYKELPAKAWVFGFDTLHHADDLVRWPDEESVLNEAKKLLTQLEKIII